MNNNDEWENWETRFDEYFENVQWTSKKGTMSIKDFIRSLLQQQREELIEEVQKVDNLFEGEALKKQNHAAETMRGLITGQLKASRPLKSAEKSATQECKHSWTSVMDDEGNDQEFCKVCGDIRLISSERKDK